MSTTAQPSPAASDQSAMSDDQIDEALQTFADGFAHSYRAPVLHTPAEEGLDFETVSFPATDGVPLEGCFIPAASS